MYLRLVPDPTNQFDRHAIKFMMPEIYQLPNHLRHERHWEELASRQVGHVRGNLCRVFKKLMDLSMLTISDIKCTYTGSVRAPALVPMHQGFSRGLCRWR